MSYAVWPPIRADLRRILINEIPEVSSHVWELDPRRPADMPLGIAYIREKLQKGDASAATQTPYGITRADGIYMLDLWWPNSLPKIDGEILADKISLRFWKDRLISSSGPDAIAGLVLRSSVRTAIPYEAWTTFPVRVEFFVRRKTSQGRL